MVEYYDLLRLFEYGDFHLKVIIYFWVTMSIEENSLWKQYVYSWLTNQISRKFFHFER